MVWIQGRLQVTNIGTLAGSPIYIVFDPAIPNQKCDQKSTRTWISERVLQVNISLQLFSVWRHHSYQIVVVDAGIRFR